MATSVSETVFPTPVPDAGEAKGPAVWKISTWFANARVPAASALHWLAAAFLVSPILAIVLTAFGGDWPTFAHLLATRLPDYFINTLVLMAGVGSLSLVFGVGTAWVTSRYEFPMRGVLEWMLVLPAAVPAYLVAYTYTDFLEYAGPVQTALRDWMGWRDARSYWFPEIRSMGGGVLVMASVLYPYVYVTARTAFRMTSVRLFEAAVLAGRRRLLAVALPLARPAIVAGLALVLMEVVSDFGTVEYFAIDTITLGIFNAWLGMWNLAVAAQLAVMAAVLVVMLLWVESRARAIRRIDNTVHGPSGVPVVEARGAWRLALPLCCLVPVMLGFVLPVSVLAGFVLSGVSGAPTERTAVAVANTVVVALVSAVLIMAIAAFIGIMAFFRSGRAGKAVTALSATGYAFPGVILAIGVLVVSGWLDAALRVPFPDSHAVVTGGLAMLVIGYIVRFQAVGYGTVLSGLRKSPPNLIEASHVLGHGFWGSVARVVLPLLRPTLLAGLLLAFVDIMKELPMSLLLRPFNYDTLATITYEFANEELLEEAAIPALVIVVAGLIPVILINRALGNPEGRARGKAAG